MSALNLETKNSKKSKICKASVRVGIDETFWNFLGSNNMCHILISCIQIVF